MDLLANLADFNLYAFMVALFLAQVLAHECGGWVGRRRVARGGPEPESVGLVVSGMLGLLAFLLALTLSFSSTRFLDRQAGTLTEANAIGTAWLRAKAIDDPRASEIARLLEEYGRQRKAFVQAPRSGDAVEMINQRTAELQAEIWGQMSAIARERRDPEVVGFMATLNETFDASSAVRFAVDVRAPSQGVWLLLGMALLTIGALGYRLSLKGQMYRALATLLIAMWTMVIVVILDLGASRLGGIRTSTAAYDWTLQGFKSGIPIPPPSKPQ